MKKLCLILFLIFSVNAVEINDLRTDLYSKSGTNVLKKVEISLELEGQNLSENKTKLIDAINVVISGFFYEDLFTELGKDNFKKVLSKFIEKKYKLKVDEVYILSLNGVEKFDLEEFKRFLKNTENKNKFEKVLNSLESPKISEQNESKNSLMDTNLSLEKEQISPKLELPKLEQEQVKTLFEESEENQNDDINIKSLNVPSIESLPQIFKQDLNESLTQ